MTLKHTIATRPGQPDIEVELTRSEIDARKVRESEVLKEDNNYIRKRGQAYARQIDPFMQEAMAELILEGRPELIEELKAKRAKIKLKHPKETL